GFITDLGYATKMVVERLRKVHTLVIETNHDEKMLQADPHRPWPVKQRIQSRHGHLSNAAAATVIEQLLAGKLERVVLGHLSRDSAEADLPAIIDIYNAATATRTSTAFFDPVSVEELHGSGYSSSPTTRWITPAGSEIQKPSKSSRSCSTSSRRGTPLIFRYDAAASVSFVSSSSQISGWLRFGTRSIQSRFGPNWKMQPSSSSSINGSPRV